MKMNSKLAAMLAAALLVGHASESHAAGGEKAKSDKALKLEVGEAAKGAEKAGHATARSEQTKQVMEGLAAKRLTQTLPDAAGDRLAENIEQSPLYKDAANHAVTTSDVAVAEAQVAVMAQMEGPAKSTADLKADSIASLTNTPKLRRIAIEALATGGARPKSNPETWTAETRAALRVALVESAYQLSLTAKSGQKFEDRCSVAFEAVQRKLKTEMKVELNERKINDLCL